MFTNKTLTKKQLAITLSRLEDFKEYNIKLEQYSTPSEICADMLWNAHLLGDIKGKVIADLASGPGFLGIGALLLGARKVYFVDVDKKAIEISVRNIIGLSLKCQKFSASSELVAESQSSSREQKISEHAQKPPRWTGHVSCASAPDIPSIYDGRFLTNAVFVNKNVQDFCEEVDVVIQNPPFGTKQKHHDKIFLEKAFSIAPVVYSFHKANTKKFVEAISKDFGFKITHYFEYDFVLKKTLKFHRKPVIKIKVGCWRLKQPKKQLSV